jgi:HD-like signal output (HDOD) protein
MKEPGNFPDHTDSPLFVEIYQDLLNDRLVLPSLPEVALKIRRMIEVEDVPVPPLARAIDAEPAISVKLVKAANGVLYHGQPKVTSCTRAVARLGLDTTKHLVMSFVLRSLFRDKIHTELLKRCARDLWCHSVEVAAISRVLAQITPGLEAEQALLAGLLHDVGELVILSYADSYPEIGGDRIALGVIISQLKAEIGATILREWEFHESFVEVARGAEDWQRNHEGPADYCDVVQVAQLHSDFGTSQKITLPAPVEVPAFARLANGRLDPALSTQVLEESRRQIEETQRLLLG